ncbi:MAG TPA: ABC transporter permease [Microbacteriaceae bacterium]|nr:ABC transporter permease [Microbacteriaceae bacterium]
MTRRRLALRGALLGVVGILGFLALWQLAAAVGWVNAKYVPPPTAVLATLGEDALDLAFWRAVGDTLITWAIGLAISIVLAVVLGTVIGLVPFLRRYTRSTVEFLRPIPSVAIIPIAIMSFGPNRDASLVIVVFATFWQVFIQVLYGVADVDTVARDTQRSFGLGPLSRFAHLVFPTSLPYLMTGIRLGATVALILTVTGELIIGVPGIGRLLTQRATAGDYAGVYAMVVAAGILALLINLIVRATERRALSWHESVRGEVVL